MKMGRRALRKALTREAIIRAAMKLFREKGFEGATVTEIVEAAGVSRRTFFRYFPSKEQIFQTLIEQYWEKVLDPEIGLYQVFADAGFPEDMERMAAAIEKAVDRFAPHILLIYVDVIEFHGEHIRSFYEGMAGRFEEVYGERFRQRQAAGDFGDVNPMVAVMVAARWFFYFFTVEKCFGAPMHFGMSPQDAVDEFIRLLRYGILPRDQESRAQGEAPAPAGGKAQPEG